MKPPVVAVLVIGAAVVAGAAGFFAGTNFAQAQSQNAVATFAQQRGLTGQGFPTPDPNDPCAGFGFRGLPGGFRPQGAAQGQTGTQGASGGQTLGNCVAAGQVKSISGDTVEISTAARVVTVKVSDQTAVTKTEQGTVSDLRTGDRVIVFSRETGSNPLASSIQIQRVFREPTPQP